MHQIAQYVQVCILSCVWQAVDKTAALIPCGSAAGACQGLPAITRLLPLPSPSFRPVCQLQMWRHWTP